MPKKGDNMIVAVQAALEHSANATAVFNPRTDKAVTVSGVYSRDYVEVGDIVGFYPLFHCMKEDAEGVARDGVVEITSQIHNITGQRFKSINDIGNGIVSIIVLQKTS